MRAPSPTRGQSGLDKLLFFLLAVVAIVFLAPHVLGLAGVDVRAPPEPGTAFASDADVDHDLYVLGVRGEAIDGSGTSVGAVRVYVAPVPGREPVDLTEGSAVWIHDGVYDLAPAGASVAGYDGSYLPTAPDGSGTVRILEGSTDRAVLTFDVGTDDVAGVGEFGERLEPGDTVTVTILTARGEAVTRELTIPEDLPRGGSVAL